MYDRFELKIDFAIEDSLPRLMADGLITHAASDDDPRLSAVRLASANERLKAKWDTCAALPFASKVELCMSTRVRMYPWALLPWHKTCSVVAWHKWCGVHRPHVSVQQSAMSMLGCMRSFTWICTCYLLCKVRGGLCLHESQLMRNVDIVTIFAGNKPVMTFCPAFVGCIWCHATQASAD